MGKTSYSKGKTVVGNVFKPIHYATRRHGNMEVGILNLDPSKAVTTRIEGATRTKGSLEVPDWRHAEVVATEVSTAAGAMRKVNLASHTHYRVMAKSTVPTGTAKYLIYSEDETAS